VAKAERFCALLGHYAAYSGSYVPTFWVNLSLLSSRVKKSAKMGPDRLSRNVGKELPTA